MIDRLEFGRTGHASSRVVFGAAALWAMRQDRADRVLELLLEHGVNHIDTAARYGESELRIAPWMKSHRRDFFLATKTGDRDYEGARESIRRSLDRLGVDCIDSIQLHHLVDVEEQRRALDEGGALEAAVEARDEGLVRFIGVTGHGTQAPAMHLRSLERFDFDSVLVPYNFTMMQNADYAADFEALRAVCRRKRVALQTIKSIARRRFADESQRRFSWYEPIDDREAIARAVRWVLAEPDVFLNSSSDARFLPATLEAASDVGQRPATDQMRADVEQLGIEPLFVRGVAEEV